MKNRRDRGLNQQEGVSVITSSDQECIQYFLASVIERWLAGGRIYFSSQSIMAGKVWWSP